MSVVTKTITEEPKKISLEIDNGDLQGLTEVMEKYKFKNEESLIRFALFTLLKAEGNTIFINEGDKKVGLTPAAHLIES
jgi:hypothetical protein